MIVPSQIVWLDHFGLVAIVQGTFTRVLSMKSVAPSDDDAHERGRAMDDGEESTQ